VLDNVERRAFRIEPAGEDPGPILVGPLHVDLDEGAGQLLVFPRRRRLAGAQADDDVLHADGLAGLQRQVADDAVALVEQAEHGNALGHRRHAGLLGRGTRHFDGDGIALGRLVLSLAAGGEGDASSQGQRARRHSWSGVQAL
jgi:hypothetical protein